MWFKLEFEGKFIRVNQIKKLGLKYIIRRKGKKGKIVWIK